MKTLDRKLRRDLLKSKGMILAILSIISVGSACFVGMLLAYNSLNLAMGRYYAQCRMADFWVDLKRAPQSEIKNILQVPGVADLRSRIVFPVMVDMKGIHRPIGGLAFSLPDHYGPAINNIMIMEGGYFTPESDDQVILSDPFAQARGLKPGHYLPVILNGQRRQLLIVGTAISSENTYLTPPGSMAADVKEYGAFYIKQSFAEDIFGYKGAANSVVGLLTPEAQRHPEATLEAIKTRLEDYGVFSAIPRSQQFSHLTLSSEMKGLQQSAVLLPVIFLGVAALVLNVLMTRMAEQQRTVIGTLKALGVDNRTIMLHFLEFGLAVGFMGGILGCFLGYWISHQMVVMYRQFFEFPDLRVFVDYGVAVAALLIALFFSGLGAIRGVWRVIHLEPAEAMRERPPGKAGQVFLERWEYIWRRLGFRWQIVLRNIFRNKVRSLVGLVAAAMGAAILLSAFGMTDAVHYLADFQFQKSIRSDINLVLQSEQAISVLNEAKRLPGVTNAEVTLELAGTFYHGHREKRGSISGVGRDAELTAALKTKGKRVPIPPAGLLMTKRMAGQLDLKVGESIDFVPVRNVRKRYSIPLVATIDSMMGLAVYANYDYLNHLIGAEASVSAIKLQVMPTQVLRDRLMDEVKHLPGVKSLIDINRQEENLNQLFIENMTGTTAVMILFGGVIFFGSILNGSLIAVTERQREIATFRALGYHSDEVGAVFFRENLLVNFAGALMGLPLGYGLILLISEEFATDAFSMPAIIHWQSYVLTMLMALLFIIGSHLIIQKTLNAQNWGEALAMKE